MFMIETDTVFIMLILTDCSSVYMTMHFVLFFISVFELN